MTNPALSERELDILKLVATGASNKEISQQLHISVNTVKVHVRNIFTKLEVSSRTEAALWAVRNGIVAVSGLSEGESTQESSTKGYWILGAVAVLFAIIGFIASQIFWPAQTPEPTMEVISISELEESRWEQLADMPTARAGLAAAAYDNKIYAIGGEGVDGVLGVNERYDPQTDTWEILKSKPIAVADVHAGVLGGKIYIPGGRLANGEVNNLMEVYDPRSNEWSQGASLPKPLSAYALETFEGKLYVFGGWDGEDYVDNVFMYDPVDDTWVGKTPMPVSRGYAGAVIASEGIYVIGGYDDNQATKVGALYLPNLDHNGSNPWKSEMYFQDDLSVSDATGIVGRIYVVDNQKNQFSLLEFDSQNHQWHTLNVPTYISKSWRSMNLVSMSSNLYLFGGVVDGEPTNRSISYRAIYTILLPSLLSVDE